jgi:hypothetical protein
MRSNSGRVRPLVGVPMTISDAPLWRCSSTLNAANSTENNVVPSARARPLSSSTIGPFTMKLRAAPGPSGLRGRGWSVASGNDDGAPSSCCRQ